ncbi:hypothetical protein LA76x_5149 [Lysobacter antibioticus]|uniref:Uncharacterized protein n=1 Tax=Lysobacter antibioticus TaxID=84531 RepID=A0A0S2FIF7_LYSAN|nr:hypothetical protein LA76x_5149 [Lysobacter antibioticus]
MHRNSRRRADPQPACARRLRQVPCEGWRVDRKLEWKAARARHCPRAPHCAIATTR